MLHMIVTHINNRLHYPIRDPIQVSIIFKVCSGVGGDAGHKVTQVVVHTSISN